MVYLHEKLGLLEQSIFKAVPTLKSALALVWKAEIYWENNVVDCKKMCGGFIHENKNKA